MHITIKEIGIEFADRYIEIQKRDDFRHVYYLTNERIKKLFSTGEIFIGAFDKDGVLMGFSSINKDIPRIRMHFLIVEQKYQGSGVGSSLLQHIISIAQKEHVRTLYMYTEEGSPLEKFLLHKKFEKAGYFRRRFGDKDATILALYP